MTRNLVQIVCFFILVGPSISDKHIEQVCKQLGADSKTCQDALQIFTVKKIGVPLIDAAAEACGKDYSVDEFKETVVMLHEHNWWSLTTVKNMLNKVKSRGAGKIKYITDVVKYTRFEWWYKMDEDIFSEKNIFDIADSIVKLQDDVKGYKETLEFYRTWKRSKQPPHKTTSLTKFQCKAESVLTIGDYMLAHKGKNAWVDYYTSSYNPIFEILCNRQNNWTQENIKAILSALSKTKNITLTETYTVLSCAHETVIKCNQNTLEELCAKVPQCKEDEDCIEDIFV